MIDRHRSPGSPEPVRSTPYVISNHCRFEPYGKTTLRVSLRCVREAIRVQHEREGFTKAIVGLHLGIGGTSTT